MPTRHAKLDVAFIERQHARLLALRKQLLGGERRVLRAKRAIEEERGDEAEEFEERAQEMADHEIGQALHDVDDRRLHAIERALQKIEEGTYGKSDVSGKPIPLARLEVTPEAVTLENEPEAGTTRRSH